MSQPSVTRLMLPLSLTTMVAFGVLFYGFSVYLTDEAAGSEFSTAILSIAWGGAILIGGLTAYPVGRYADRSGIRWIIGVGSLTGWAGLMLFSAASDEWQVIAISWLLIGPAGAMTFYEPAFVAVDQWFVPDRRPTALAILMVIGGLAGALFIPGTERLVALLDWRNAARVSAFLLLAVGVATAAWVLPSGRRDARRLLGAVPARLGWIRERRFVLFTVALVLLFGSLQAVLFHRLARFEESGFAVALVASWAGIAALLSLPGRSVAPFLGGRFRPTSVLAFFILLTAISTALAIEGSSLFQLVGHFALFGVAFGATIPLRAMVMSSWYSGRRYGEIMGAQWMLVAVVGATFPAGVGVMRDAVGTYSPPMALITILLVFSAGLTVMSEQGSVVVDA